MSASFQADLAALAYLVSGVLFILALRGLSSPVTSRAGNRNGMIGMALAIATTLWVTHVTDALTWGMIVVAIAIGGGIGAVIARRIAMTAMPQLVAAFHSLVGLAAVLVAAAAFYSPAAYGIGSEGAIRMQSLIEMSLGVLTGALVGSSGAILSYIMCAGMNRSFISVIAGGFGGEVAAAGKAETRPVKQGSAEDAAFIMKNAGSVIIVPGYGMAVAQAQHAVREMADKLKAEGVKVSYAIHPVAGRMPRHMNVLLAEANVPYDEVFELEDINSAFAQTDVAYVIGANDVTNPAAKNNPQSPIFGMPILDVDKAKTVLFIKRGMGSGYAGIENELFFRDNTMMLFGDAKKM